MTCKILGIITILLYLAVVLEAFTISEIAVDLWGDPQLGTLTNKKKVDIGIAVFNILGNVVILVLPLRPIWKLQMRVKTKISLTVLFGLGICVIIVSCVRLTAVVPASEDVRELLTSGTRDMPFHLIEPELAIFTICLPVLRPLWAKLHEKYGSTGAQPHNSRSENNLGFNGGDDENLWRKYGYNVGRLSSHYNVTIGVDTSRVLHSPGQSVHDPSHIRVDRTWGVSYDAPSTTR
ncbi:hypothetical protein GGS26DRAFT_591202 [Hypomontagnella submonticulosa]|nr:hypothetical protein GGS26DRAFT_591202 [Hypomontagnella submonticulosa]